MAKSHCFVPFAYDDEPFFKAYDALYGVWAKRKSQKVLTASLRIGKNTLKNWEDNFVAYGALGLLAQRSFIKVSPQLEKLVILIKSSRRHEGASLALKLSDALEIPGASLALIRKVQRCYGYGKRMDETDIGYYQGLQHILTSISIHKQKKKRPHDKSDRAKTFFNFDRDPFQQRIELFKTLSQIRKKRQIRPIVKKFGVHPNRYYTLKDRYMRYGVWGLADLVQTTKVGEKISPELELQIIEQRLMDPSLSANKIIKKLDLKCSKGNVQKVYQKWNLSKFKHSVPIRGVLSRNVPKSLPKKSDIEPSARTRFPDLIKTSRLKINGSFQRLIKCLAYRKVTISNPGAMIAAVFLDQLGVVEALHTYGPVPYLSSDITNTIIVNVLRIIAGFPTIHDYSLNSDRSVAVSAGLTLNPCKSRFYDSFDLLRFNHLQRLRNDASCRARELGVIEGKAIAVDYHCDPSDSRFPIDKSFSKSPDKKGDLVMRIVLKFYGTV